MSYRAPTPVVPTSAVDPAGRQPVDVSPPGRDRGWWVAATIVVIAIVGIAVLLALPRPAGEHTATTVSAVAIAPGPYLGERVIVTGRIEELLSDRALTIGTDLTDRSILVLITPEASIEGYGMAPGALPPVPVGVTYDVGDVAQFAGEVRIFDRAAMEQELGLVLNEELFASFDGQPTLVMDRLDVATLAGTAPAATTVPA